MKVVGNGKATLSEKHFDELTKFEEDVALKSTLLITEIYGRELPKNVKRYELDPLFVRIQK